MGRKSRLFVHSIWSPDSRFADLQVEIANLVVSHLAAP
jgi:hypothetical protein